MVGNTVTLVLTLVVMLSLSWQVTLLALLLLPVFVYPARRVGQTLAAMERESAGHNAAMTTQVTERFSAPGATLVKLFGRPEHELAEFGARAARVRDIGVRTALASARVEIMTALVSFERVFEVLDLPPLITERADPLELPDGALGVEFRDVRFGGAHQSDHLAGPNWVRYSPSRPWTRR